ncbi:MAG TPA: hypothetical protein PK265_01130 [Candidatus Saccharibacteria bacterium]|nr:hypothetical protein [Candidatus Saccharibacteria bacterium]
MRRRRDKGDTLIEVLFAVSVFSLVAVGGISIMNQGSAASQRSLEITLVRQQIDSQAETLRFLNSSYVSAYSTGATYPAGTPAGQWQQIRDNIKSSGAKDASSFGVGSGDCPVSPPDGSFIMNTHGAKFVSLAGDKYTPATTYSQVRYIQDGSTQVIDSSEGLWVEGVLSDTDNTDSQGNAGYIDFHIRACWDSPGLSVPMTLGTIVRLYEPRG